MFSKAGQKSLALRWTVPCEKAPATSQPESIAVRRVSRAGRSCQRSKGFGSALGSDLLQIGCAALGKDSRHCLLPQLVASTGMIFPTLVGKTVLAVLSLASEASSRGRVGEAAQQPATSRNTQAVPPGCAVPSAQRPRQWELPVPARRAEGDALHCL